MAKNKAAAALGRLGGAAGRGAAKARGPMPASVRTLGVLARLARSGADDARLHRAAEEARDAGASATRIAELLQAARRP